MKIGNEDEIGFVRLNELPDEFIGIVENIEEKEDVRVAADGTVLSRRKSLFVTIRTDVNGEIRRVTQKFTPNQRSYLNEALLGMGLTEYEEAIENIYKFVKTVKPYMGEPLANGNPTQPRWLPQPAPKRRKGKKGPAN